jgi:hypothetical protein
MVPELRGRVLDIVKQQIGSDEAPNYNQELRAAGPKVFIATAHPDPLFGIVDARVSASVNWIGNSKRVAVKSMNGFEAAPFQRTQAYEEMERLALGISESTFVTIVSRQGRASAVIDDASFDAVKQAFFSSDLSPARALVVGAGGAGYDDTLSSAIRASWNALEGVRKSGQILLIAECGGGLGSKALEMLIAGRLDGDGTGTRRRGAERYVDGLEEVSYLHTLKEDYEVLLLSGLPELYTRTKLGLASAKGTREALGKLLNKLGRTTKINVVSRASECRITPAT